MSRLFFFFSCLTIIMTCGHVPGQSSPEPIKVGVTSAPPYLVVDSKRITGLNADLWISLADSLRLSYQYIHYHSLKDLLSALQSGEVDISIYPLTITSKRLMDFRLTVPYYSSKLGVVRKSADQIPLFSIVLDLINWRTIKLLLALFIVVFIFAFLIWITERRKNHGEFHRGTRGIGDGIWWAFTTMTTVGYGDKVPKTHLGRILTIIWMLYAIALLFVFTAEISSELTLIKLRSDIHSLEDLRKVKVGTIYGTGFSEMLEINHVTFYPFPSPVEGVNAVKSGMIDLFVYDEATLNYILSNDKYLSGLEIISTNLSDQYFCFGANKQTAWLIDDINPVLLAITESATWKKILITYGVIVY